MDIKPGVYQHFKGKTYKVVGVAMDAGTLSKSVVYQGLYHSEDAGVHPMFIRALAEFQDSITRPEYSGPRFIKLAASGPYVCKDCGKEV